MSSSLLDLFGDGFSGAGYYQLTLNDDDTLVKNSDFSNSDITRFSVTESGEVYTSIVEEGFSNGFGNTFLDGGKDTSYVASKFGREGLVMLQRGSVKGDQALLFSQTIGLDERGDVSKFKVDFSFYAINTSGNDRLCLEYKVNGSSTWKDAQCWKSGRDYQNGRWNDNVSSTFQPGAVLSNDIRIRLRSYADELADQFYVDRIELSGLHQ